MTHKTFAGERDARRVRPEEDANNVAAEQIWELIGRLPQQPEAPLFVFDVGYDPVRLQLQIEGCPAQILVRLHSGRTFYAEPKVPPKRPVGRPSRHGAKFSFKEPRTWPRPTGEHHTRSAGYGNVCARAWSGLHPKTRRAVERYGVESAALVRGTVILVEVDHLPRGEKRRESKKLWLWWHGPGEPELELLWRVYVRRFDLEHTFRFLKQTLVWTTSGCAIPSKPIAGVGWCSLPTCSCAWHESVRRGPEASLGAPLPSRLPDTVAGSSRSFSTFACTGTLAKPSRPCVHSPRGVAQGSPFGPGEALPGAQKERLSG